MIKGTTSSGFEYEIDEKKLDDMELLELFGSLEKNPFNLTVIIEKMFGQEQKQALYDHLRTEDGRVPYKAFEKELGEILNKENETKNS